LLDITGSMANWCINALVLDRGIGLFRRCREQMSLLKNLEERCRRLYLPSNQHDQGLFMF
jgi:hypothetical protein